MSTQKSNHFDLLTTGLGWLNEIQEVTPDSGLPYLVVRIAALSGKRDNVRKAYFTCRVSGRNAHEFVRLLSPDVERKRKVLIRFQTNGVHGESFIFQRGREKGTVGISFKASLISIDWAQVDGMKVAKANVAT